MKGVEGYTVILYYHVSFFEGLAAYRTLVIVRVGEFPEEDILLFVEIVVPGWAFFFEHSAEDVFVRDSENHLKEELSSDLKILASTTSQISGQFRENLAP